MQSKQNKNGFVNPYTILNLNDEDLMENGRFDTNQLKKAYMKLSLAVHPDKCKHSDSHKVIILII